MTRVNNSGDTMRRPLGIYIHIPFCLRKCNYCAFLSEAGRQEAEMRAYIDALISELVYRSGQLQDDYRVDTVFIGGGTPSILPTGEIRRILTALRANFFMGDEAAEASSAKPTSSENDKKRKERPEAEPKRVPEITIEANPATVTAEKLAEYRESGVNRLSIGAQSFDKELLRVLGRVHGVQDIGQTVELARQAGFFNLNLDLMFGIPGQTTVCWLDTLEQAAKLQPQHISCYSLQLEEGTPFFRMFEAGELQEIPDETDRQMYHEGIALLKSVGLSLYEISNFSVPGMECRHNLKYWSLEEYLGIGLGAHSFLGFSAQYNMKQCHRYEGGRRFSNSTDMRRYLKQQWPAEAESHDNTAYDNISEYIFTGLRKKEGIELSILPPERRAALLQAAEPYRNQGLLKLTQSGIAFCGSGADISNGILADLI